MTWEHFVANAGIFLVFILFRRWCAYEDEMQAKEDAHRAGAGDTR